MSLKINLYHEVLRTKKQRQYDPLKISILGLIVVAIGLAGYYFVALAQRRSVVAEYTAKQKEFDTLVPLAKAAKLREEELSNQISLAERLGKRIENRFYWAPVLEVVASSVPLNVQITKLGADIAQEAPRTCQISVDGLAAGAKPRAVAEELRMALAEKFGQKFKGAITTFKSLDESNERVLLDGQMELTAVFSISITFPFGSAEPSAPAALPTRRRSKS